MHNIPNLISVVRLLLVPLTVWLLISGAYGYAFTTFVVAGVSDGIDGYLARRFDWRSRLGAYLDPLADKALLVSVFLTLGFLKLIPAWLVIVVVSRDALIVGAVLLSRLMDHPVHVRPLMVSKVNTVAQIGFVVVVLGTAALGKPLIVMHQDEHQHALKEVDAAALVVAQTPQQVAAALRYVMTGALPK